MCFIFWGEGGGTECLNVVSDNKASANEAFLHRSKVHI